MISLPQDIIIFEFSYRRHYLRFFVQGHICYFYRSTPGPGTKVASICLKQFEHENYETHYLLLSWNTCGGFAGVGTDNGKRVSSELGNSSLQYHVAPEGKNKNIAISYGDVSDLRISNGKETLVEPTAIEHWDKIQRCANELLEHAKTQSFHLQVLLVGQILVMLVNGIESFLRKRFIELEEEGVKPNIEKLVPELYRAADSANKIESLRKEGTTEPLKEAVRIVVSEKQINFQSIQDAKKLFNKCYGLRFGSSVRSDIIADAKKYIEYRHTVVHFSPTEPRVHIGSASKGDRSVYLTPELLENAILVFAEFIERINAAALLLNRDI